MDEWEQQYVSLLIRMGYYMGIMFATIDGVSVGMLCSHVVLPWSPVTLRGCISLQGFCVGWHNCSGGVPLYSPCTISMLGT